MRAQAPGGQASRVPDRDQAMSGPYVREVVAAPVVAGLGATDRGSATEEIQAQLQNDFG
jgi:hypothetical protein